MAFGGLEMWQKNKFSDYPFSIQGRFSRLSYLAWVGLLTLIALIVVLINTLLVSRNISAEAMLDQPPTLSYLFWPSWIVLIIFFYLSNVFMIRRLHDLNRTGWLGLIVYVPVIGFLFWLYLVLAHGSTERNRYGRPRDASVWEGIFGLIWGGLLFGSLLFLGVYAVLNPNIQHFDILSVLLKK
ncbi:DUF805 domain-containing protein [Aquirhabdus sp.]|uniref:DUF805 domain-containing protein n=1 Tax=Aquirhabdus sp. TaxID=2824160 RepID=UPI00396C84A1